MKEESEDDIRRLLAELAEESERTRDDPYPPGAVSSPAPDTVVQSVRLHTSDLDEIKALSESSGVPVSVLIRGWIKQGLAAERDSTIEGSLDRLAEELNRLRRVTRRAV
jgi:hypothetical protein